MDYLPWAKKRFRKPYRELRPHCGRYWVKIIICWSYLSKTCYWVTLSDIFIDSVRAHSFYCCSYNTVWKSNSPCLLHQKKRQPTKWLSLIEWDKLSSSMVIWFSPLSLRIVTWGKASPSLLSFTCFLLPCLSLLKFRPATLSKVQNTGNLYPCFSQ